MAHDPWTEAEIKILRENYGTKMGATDIGKLVHKSRNAVIGKAHRLGLEAANRGWKTYRNDTTPERKAKSSFNSMPKMPKKVGNHVSGALNNIAHNRELEEVTLDLKNLKCEPVSLMDRRDDQCEWPLDDGNYCGLPKYTKSEYRGTRYCIHHYRASVKPASAHRRLNKRR